MQITSLNNVRVKQWTKLKKKKYREQQRQYLVEGEHLVTEALKSGIVETILSIQPLEISNVECIEVTSEIIEKISSVDTPQPIIAVCRMKDEEMLLKDQHKYLLLDDLQDPGNIGTLVRTAVAFGYDQVILSQNSVDLYNEKFIRATQGACFHISCIKTDLAVAIDELKKNGVKVYGTSLENGKDIQQVDKPDKLAILLGNEGNGVSDLLLAKTDFNIYIPITTAESLNVAIAGGICMFYFNM